MHMKDALILTLGPLHCPICICQCPLSWALANADGSLRNKTGPHLPGNLRKCISQGSNPNSAILYLVQRMNRNTKHIAQLTDSVLSLALYLGGHSLDRVISPVDVVVDVYSQKVGHSIHKRRKFLCSSCNKTSLIKVTLKVRKSGNYRDAYIDMMQG